MTTPPPPDPAQTLINGKSLACILAMPAAFALPLLSAAKDYRVVMQAAYDHESTHKCRYQVSTQIKEWLGIPTLPYDESIPSRAATTSPVSPENQPELF